MSDTKTIAKAVAYFRQKKHWSRSTLATRAGITASYISMLERGQRTGQVREDTLWKLASALEVSVDALTEFTGEEKAAKVAKEAAATYGEKKRTERLFRMLQQLTDDQLEALELFVERLLARGIGRG
ncbi:MAG TPA: helix-turn-helix transcriptional regulator [Anaerolineales bacterium]|nr:helix-turn-helix transcriptional regulator [Anaerolineales bacterium]